MTAGAGARRRLVAGARVARARRLARRGHHGRLRGLRPRPARGPVGAGDPEADRAAGQRRRLSSSRPRPGSSPSCAPRVRLRRGGGRAAAGRGRTRRAPGAHGRPPGARGAAGADRSAGRSSAGCGSGWCPGCSSRAGAPRRSSSCAARCSRPTTAPGGGRPVLRHRGRSGSRRGRRTGPRAARRRRRPRRGRLRPAQRHRRARCTRATCTTPSRATCAAGSTCSLVNAPYVPTDEIALMPPEARLHEHHVALDGGADGLDAAPPGGGGRSRLAGARGQPADRDQPLPGRRHRSRPAREAGLSVEVVGPDDQGMSVVVRAISEPGGSSGTMAR